MASGTYFCLFYETKEDLLNVLLQYFKASILLQHLTIATLLLGDIRQN